MIQQLIHRFLLRRHFWRYATFSEVAELYASRTIRIFALRMVSTFTAVYLYLEGYDLAFIAFFWAAFYLVKTVSAWPSGRLVAKYGPKHATLISNIVSAVAMIALPFTTHAEYGLFALAAWCTLQGFSSSLNDLAYLVDFSKVKNALHAGKEIGYMNILERVATGLSPVVGGFIAFILGPEAVMILSAVLFLLSAVPLLQTAEPVETHRKLDFTAFPWRTTWRSLVAETAVGVDVMASGIAWPLLMAVVVFQSGTDKVYAEIGVVTSVALIIALLTSYVFGKAIDRRKGRELLRYATLANSAVHAARVLVSTPAGVIAANTANEAATTGYSMAFIRGMFDTADLSGKRIEYFYLIELAVNIGSTIAALLLGAFFIVFGQTFSLQLFFFAVASLTLLIATPRFALYKK